MAISVHFAAYETYTAPERESDTLWHKWLGVRNRLEVPNFPLQLPMTSLILGIFNKTVNSFVNYQTERKGEDSWQTPMETWQKQTGDCEDFAILKYALLKASGMSEDGMWIVIGEIKNILANKPHAWLAVHLEDKWHVLDSMFDQLIDPNEYINWLPISALHDDEMVVYGKAFRIADLMRDGNA